MLLCDEFRQRFNVTHKEETHDLRLQDMQSETTRGGHNGHPHEKNQQQKKKDPKKKNICTENRKKAHIFKILENEEITEKQRQSQKTKAPYKEKGTT